MRNDSSSVCVAIYFKLRIFSYLDCESLRWSRKTQFSRCTYYFSLTDWVFVVICEGFGIQLPWLLIFHKLLDWKFSLTSALWWLLKEHVVQSWQHLLCLYGMRLLTTLPLCWKWSRRDNESLTSDSNCEQLTKRAQCCVLALLRHLSCLISDYLPGPIFPEDRSSKHLILDA